MREIINEVLHQNRYFFYLARQPPQWDRAFSFTRFLDHTTTHHSRWDSSRRVISSSQRPLPDNTQHSRQTDIHVSGVIRTQNLSGRAVADLPLRPRGHWDRLRIEIGCPKNKETNICKQILHSFSQNMKYVFFTRFSLKRFTTYDTYLGVETFSHSRSFEVGVLYVVNHVCVNALMYDKLKICSLL